MLNEEVVLDTTTPIVYIGTLVEVTEHTFVLTDADMHDCRDGHADKELYLRETREHGVAANRRKLVVLRNAVISASRLKDIAAD
jgi:small nuclear ribonucleoprotein (snRNP)-like protein